MGPNKSKFRIGDSAFVVDKAEYIRNNAVCRIPLGTEVRVRAVSVFKSKGSADVRYEVSFNGGPLVCWVNEDRLTAKIFDVACAA